MTRFKRRILLGTTLVVLVLLGLGVWFYITFFGSTNAALQHAETFLFRRMKVVQLAEKGTYRFFYVINRHQFNLLAQKKCHKYVTSGNFNRKSFYWMLLCCPSYFPPTNLSSFLSARPLSEYLYFEIHFVVMKTRGK